MARKHRGGHQEEESSERWLLTYADMITLLMALFMVLFSISSVNISKYRVLQHSLKAAFSGDILPGGKSIMAPGASSNADKAPSSLDTQAIVPITAQTASSLQNSTTHGAQNGASASQSQAQSQAQEQAAARQQAEFEHIKQRLEAYAKSHGFAKSVQATVEQRGLDIRVLTDDLLFESGQATLDPRADGLLNEISELLNVDQTHPIAVEGNTDNVPIHSAMFPSNWELSTARASTVVRFLVSHQVSPTRLTAVGNAEQHPVESNLTPQGRTRNRRVEIVMQRLNSSETTTEP
jgi:chemotaxis protein MotB